MRLPLLLAALATVGCRATHISEFAQSLRDQDIRSLIAAPEMTIVSPFGPERTAELLNEVRRNLNAIEVLLETKVPASLTVHFKIQPAQPLPMQLSKDASSLGLPYTDGRPTHRLRGFAVSGTDIPQILVYVPAQSTPSPLPTPGQRSIATMAPSGFDPAPTIRHEIAHICASFAGLEGPTWFTEGLAREFQSRQFNGHGQLALTAQVPDDLITARLNYEAYSIDDLLDWEESLTTEVIKTGTGEIFTMGRPLAHALMRFLLEREQREHQASLRQQLERIQAMTPDQLRALDAEWRAWMKSLPDWR